MAFRRLIDRIREEGERERAQSAIAVQGAIYRQWHRNPAQAQALLRDTGMTPGELNPIARGYHVLKADDPGLRPSNFFQRMRRRTPEDIFGVGAGAGLDQGDPFGPPSPAFDTGFEPLGPPVPQFGPPSPELLGPPSPPLLGPWEEGDLRGFGEWAAGAPLTDLAGVSALRNVAQQQGMDASGLLSLMETGPEFQRAGLGRELEQQTGQELERFLPGQGPMALIRAGTTPLAGGPEGANPLQWLEENVPVAGGPLSRSLGFASSPIGLASLGVAPGATVAGEIGAVGLGTLGELAGLPTPAQYGVEALGGLTPAGLVSRPGRALLSELRPRTADDILTPLPATRIDTSPPPGVRSVPDETPPVQGLRPDVPPVRAEVPDEIVPPVREAAPPPGLADEALPPVRALDDETARAAAELEALGVPPIGGGSPTERLVELVRAAKPVREATERLRSQELGRRVAVGSRALESGRGEAAFRQAKTTLRGELPTAAFDPPRGALRTEEITDLYDLIRTKEGLTFFDRISTEGALTKVLAGELPTRSEIAHLQRTFGVDLAKAVLSKRSLGTKAFENFMMTLNVPRELMASFDLSAPLRQGALMIRHTPEYARAFGTMLRVAARPKVAEEIDVLLRAGKAAERRQAAKLFIADIAESAALTDREEVFMSRLLRNIPGVGEGVKRSQLAYTTFLNKLRADTFDNLVGGLDRAGRASTEEDRLIADMINKLTGRGSLGPAGEYAQVLGQTFFSARLLVSRPQTVMLLFSKSPTVRKVVAQDLATFVGTGIGLLSLAKLAGADVQLDPRSTDFGKIRVGNQRLDFWAGFQPLARYFAQVATGQRVDALGDVQNISRKEAIFRFFDSKLSPQAGFVQDVIQGETFLGEKMEADTETLKRETYNRLTPLFIQDFKEAVEEHGLLGGALAAPGFFGASGQTYETPSTRTANLIREDILKGELTGTYENIPKRIGGDNGLTATDRERFLELHPELVEQFEASQAETLGSVSERQESAVRSADIDAAKTDRDEKFENVVEQAKTVDPAEQENRKGLYDRIQQARSAYGSIVANEMRDVEPGEPGSRERELVLRHRALGEQHEGRFTLVGEAADEAWAAWEKAEAEAFTPEELEIIERETGVNRHPLEKVLRELNEKLGPYYDIPIPEPKGEESDNPFLSSGTQRQRNPFTETAGAGTPREEYRLRHPEVDGTLWALGRVSRVMSPRSRRYAIEAYERLYGRKPRPGQISLGEEAESKNPFLR